MQKVNGKRIAAILTVASFVFTLSGCDEPSGAILEEETVATISTTEDVSVEVQEKEMVKIETVHSVQYQDLTIPFKAEYAIEKNRAENWMFTQPSVIDLNLDIDSVPEGTTALVSAVYADISLLAAYTEFNGIRQDSMYVEYNTLPTGGISIRPTDGFTIPFQIEAVDKNETFYHSFNGYGSSYTYRITEGRIAEYTHGTVLNVVWTILLKDDATGNMYVKTINDRVGIPYNRRASDNSIEKTSTEK